MSARDEAVERVIRAWIDAGPVPQYHYEAQGQLRRDWPTLANAIEGLIATIILEGR